MGRKKIQITRIVDERNRQVTFTKRKFGLMKKAYELSVLCDCEIALIIFNSSNKLFQYASTDMDKVLLKYTEYNEPHESRTNSDIVEALNKKEHRGCESPDPDTSSYILTPHTEEKYQKINEEFDNMMRNHKIPAVLSQQSFTLPVAVPVDDPSALSYSAAGSLSTPALPSASVSLSEAAMLSLSSSTLHTSPSALLSGGIHSSSDSTPNGVHPSSAANGFIITQGENGMGRGLQAKSPAPPAGSLAQMGHKPELRVLIPPACKGAVPALPEEGEGDLRINSPQSSQSLTTPVVSMATPSLPPQGLSYTAMTSAAYNSDYTLNSSEISNFNSGFNLPESLSLASGSTWQHTSMGQSAPQSASQGAARPLAQVSKPPCSSPIIDIKAEPISPPRERGSSMVFLTLPPPSSRQDLGRSPAESLSSSCSSYEGSDREDQRRDSSHQSVLGQGRPPSVPEGSGRPSLKRLRTDNWVT
ncbi:myocyte-specific enhancer factor 2A isoform X1 [Astyanax mexicanus]|uniref:myocyte-specific enhancer factor 2A isoform X1 n=1 Tax=Astyanax mexicanus TaxID=7994 RepID=UPI0020CB1605|nr:myocyte-specific enhancer factor 2A isoform X1 [Astyanax mexicanus]XP_007246200.3 myocyte-specific enhancer factor 2A isoform X1 [Astyanax mexicanus]XP_007246202.3 myocyte-specific enhancer factor 2A isoform X1 [Astyanax mexicanus]XP_015460501.3 myocyte-specific enhancer factor 2A isoform X1 [Astyanax mexicanus]